MNVPIIIRNVSEFLAQSNFENKVLIRHQEFCFRGESRDFGNTSLVSSLGRLYDGQDIKVEEERKTLIEFEYRSTQFYSQIHLDEWEKLALAQHYMLPTRLLDFTFNPLIALFFACDGNLDEDGVVYRTFIAPGKLETISDMKREYNNNDPMDFLRGGLFKNRQFIFLKTRHIDKRLSSQDGLFCVVSEPSKSLKEYEDFKNNTKIIHVPALYKEHILLELDMLGINAATVYQDLDNSGKQTKKRLLQRLALQKED